MEKMHVDVDGCRLSFSVEGPQQAPALLLLNALGTTTDLWAAQAPLLSRVLRVIRCDTRGHGASGAPAGDYTLDRLGHDALAILDAAGAPRAHVCGLSLGGLEALWLARHAPERVDRVVAAKGSPAPAGWPWTRPTSPIFTKIGGRFADLGGFRGVRGL